MRKKRPIQRLENRTRDASLVVIASEDLSAVKQYFELFQPYSESIPYLGNRSLGIVVTACHGEIGSILALRHCVARGNPNTRRYILRILTSTAGLFDLDS